METALLEPTAPAFLWPLLLFAAALLAISWFSRQISLRVQSITYLATGSIQAAVVAYFLLLLPGIVAHEASHWLMAFCDWSTQAVRQSRTPNSSPMQSSTSVQMSVQSMSSSAQPSVKRGTAARTTMRRKILSIISSNSRERSPGNVPFDVLLEHAFAPIGPACVCAAPRHVHDEKPDACRTHRITMIRCSLKMSALSRRCARSAQRYGFSLSAMGRGGCKRTACRPR